MTVLVTGRAGHFGEALMRRLPHAGHQAIGLDIKASAFTQRVGSITDRRLVERCIRGVDAVVHTATLHKPHIATHSRQDFVDTNVTGTLNLLEAATAAGACPATRTRTPAADGRCSLASTGSTSTRERGARSVGNRDTTSSA